MQYFDGKHSLEEIQYETGLDRRTLRAVLDVYHTDVSVPPSSKIASHRKLTLSMITSPQLIVFQHP